MNRNDTLLWRADLKDGYYTNPILHTDYSDPDVIRVGDTFYMTASSFNFVPGLPILVSKDLVNWELVNYAVKEIPFPDYNKPAHGRGIWAPSIRYHNNKFYIFVGMPDEGIFVTETEDPYGTWSPLTPVWEGKGYIDPCPFWDEDGKAYIIHAYAKSRIGYKSKLGMLGLDMDKMKCISEDRFIFDGTKTQPTIEGPKVYKRDGYYYIFAPAGGVRNGWQTVLRSENIYGPYNEKIVMHQGSTPINGPHQGGLVDTSTGEEWFIHFQDKGVYGRIVHLQPVFWEEDWPIIGVSKDQKDIGEPVLRYKKPDGCEICEPREPEKAWDDFNEEKLGLPWQWTGNPNESFFSLTERKGYLRLNSVTTKESLWNCSNVLTRKIACESFQVTVKMDLSQLADGNRAGVVMLGGGYASLMISIEEEQPYICYVEETGGNELKEERMITKEPLFIDHKTTSVYMKINFRQYGFLSFSISEDGAHWKYETPEYQLKDGLWVGGKIGLFACNYGDAKQVGYADIEYVHIERN